MDSTRLENGNKVSVEYSVGVAYGFVVAIDSNIASKIMAAYCDPEEQRIEEISYYDFKRDYPSLLIETSMDNWSGSITNNAIFYVADSFKNINPRDDSYDAFYVNDLEPTTEAKNELSKFAARFGIEDTPGMCIWSSIF